MPADNDRPAGAGTLYTRGQIALDVSQPLSHVSQRYPSYTDLPRSCQLLLSFEPTGPGLPFAREMTNLLLQ
jgi:hypothetical protein